MDDCANVHHILGFVIKPIDYNLITTLASVLGLTAMFGWILNKWRARGNRQMHQYVDSGNEVSEPDKDKCRTLAIRHFDEPKKVEEMILSAKVRKWLMNAAVYCDWTHRFIKHPKSAHQKDILVACRNVLIRHWKEGQAAHMAGLPTVRTTLIFAVTGSDTEDEGVRMIRVVLVSLEMLKIIHEHPADKWLFEGEEERMRVRLETLRKMAEAYFENGGYRPGKNGTNVRIVMEAYVRSRI